jgi:hypothetical protein
VCVFLNFSIYCENTLIHFLSREDFFRVERVDKSKWRKKKEEESQQGKSLFFENRKGGKGFFTVSSSNC